MTTESEKLVNSPPTEIGWYWVATNPAWRDRPEVVFIGYPEYNNELHVYTINIIDRILPLDIFCSKFPRMWLGKIEYPPKW